jgi:hypothetical protein
VELHKAEKLAREKPVKDMTSAERWAVYFFYNADRSEFACDLIDEITEKEKGVKMAREVLNGFSEDEARYLWLMSRQKGESDHYNRMTEAEERGFKEAAQALAEQAAALADKDAALAEQAALIAALRARLGDSE